MEAGFDHRPIASLGLIDRVADCGARHGADAGADDRSRGRIVKLMADDSADDAAGSGPGQYAGLRIGLTADSRGASDGRKTKGEFAKHGYPSPKLGQCLAVRSRPLDKPWPCPIIGHMGQGRLTLPPD